MPSNLKLRFFTLVRRQLPSNLRSSSNFYFLTFTISALFWLLLLVPFFAYGGLEKQAWSSAICSLIIATSLILWRLGVKINVVQSIFQGAMIWCISYNAYYTGGITSPVMAWMGIVPILPLFTSSRQWSYGWLAITFVSVIAIYLFQVYGFIPAPSGENLNHANLKLSVSMIGLLCLTQLMLVMTYDAANAQALRVMTRKNLILKNLSQNLQQANLYKDQFLATVSHEMRTPLNAITGYLGLLTNLDEIPAFAASYVQGAQNSAAHLLTVINDLLDFSQIRQGKLVFTPQIVDLHKVLKDTHQTLAPKAAAQALDYTLTIDTSVPSWVRIDPHRFTQIFLNILGNALKFTVKGSVISHVRFELNSNEPQLGNLVLTIKDTGVGIPKESIAHIFEPFVQLNTHNKFGNDNALKGNGLGLSITQSLVKNLGGTITIASEMGKSSTFEIHLPLEITSAPQANKQTPIGQTHSNQVYLLLVDDHATNRLVASATIKRALPNARIDEARNGTEAIQLMKINQYDVVLMDLIMPDYSGIEVTKIIRAECTPPFCDVDVVALTANVADEAAKACLEVGIKELLPKPFDREVLIRTILHYVV